MYRCTLCNTGLEYETLELLRLHLRHYHRGHTALEEVPAVHRDDDSDDLHTTLAPFFTPAEHSAEDEREIHPGGGTFGGAGAGGGWDSGGDDKSGSFDSSSSDSSSSNDSSSPGSE